MNNELYQLWVKETDTSPLYVDVFHNLRETCAFRESDWESVNDEQKDNSLAVEYRKCGNGFIEEGDYKAAIEQYNKSLCFAENGTDAISLAYANRSYCFLELKMYDECLADIESAINANYPKKSMKKLELRKALCLKSMDESIARTPSIQPQLSFESSDMIEYMANVLAIERNDEFGRHFKAKANIPEDRVILIEEPLIKLVDITSKYKRCSICLKQYTNLIPCEICTEVLFCNGECSSSAKLHKYECNMKHCKLFDGKQGSDARNCVKFALRAVLRGLETFSSSDRLMKYVEFIRMENDINQVIVADESFESMLGIFLTHHDNVSNPSGRAKILIISCVVYDYIMAHSELKTNFLSEKLQRFLMHLVTHLVTIYSANNILLQDWSESWSDILQHNSTETFGAGVFNISSYINHSCMPNTVRLTTPDHMILKTIRPINKGEQIFVRYAIDPNWPTKQRREQLFHVCGFVCNCQLCASDGPLMTDVSVVSTELLNLSAELAPLLFLKVKEANKWAIVKDKLFQFVKKYDAAALPISKSIILAYEYIRMILIREFSYSST